MTSGMVIRRHVPRFEGTGDCDNRPRTDHPHQPRRKTQASSPSHKSAKLSCLFPVYRLIPPLILVLVTGLCMLHKMPQQRQMPSPLYPKFASALRPRRNKSSHLNFRPEGFSPRMAQLHDDMSIHDRGEENPWYGGDDDEECVPMHKWMLPSHSPYTCNSLQELDFRMSLKFINSGGSRSAFEIEDHTGRPMVLKMQK